MATPAKRALPPTPPDKGSFPLDHFGACRPAQLEYMLCVRESKSRSSGCKEEMKKYLECRMNNGLMAQEDLNQLGFAARDEDASATGAQQEQRK